MAAAAVATRKRPAPGGSGAPGKTKKRARITYGSIYDYETLEVLGEGSYGVVVKARHRPTGETVAVKWAKKPGLRGVLREAGCLAACRGHPSVVGIRDLAADAAGESVFLVMEFVGPSLRRALATRGRFPEREARGFMRQLLRGAERMHGAGIIHRDIKPENILVGPGGALKICDLGLATPARPAGTSYPELRVGTLRYRSPEQLMGHRSYGPAVDVWALGCVMAELLTGEPLFDGVTEDDMVTKVLDWQLEFSAKGLQAFDGMPEFEGLPELSPDAREVLAGLLSFFPDERLTATAALQHRWFATETEAEQQC
ncbi:hypothetical protein ACP70R_022848 [Stipagrostis hirtigluma subsp. patula]